mmetsp:Transcript_52304/g.156989  ORF Transcript_52304/g.156989 Transcript_52304/m.156989 type:complete len:313 (-) Transcript_52304:238-1176(-)
MLSLLPPPPPQRERSASASSRAPEKSVRASQLVTIKPTVRGRAICSHRARSSAARTGSTSLAITRHSRSRGNEARRRESSSCSVLDPGEAHRSRKRSGGGRRGLLVSSSRGGFPDGHPPPLLASASASPPLPSVGGSGCSSSLLRRARISRSTGRQLTDSCCSTRPETLASGRKLRWRREYDAALEGVRVQSTGTDDGFARDSSRGDAFRASSKGGRSNTTSHDASGTKEARNGAGSFCAGSKPNEVSATAMARSRAPSPWPSEPFRTNRSVRGRGWERALSNVPPSKYSRRVECAPVPEGSESAPPSPSPR